MPIGKEPLVFLRNLTAQVKLGNGELLKTVDSVTLSLFKGDTYAVVGKSGSGKTSLISIIGLLNSDFTGEYYYKGESVATLKDSAASIMRARSIGFVFQNYSLVQHLNVYENIELPLLYSKKRLNSKQRRILVEKALEDVSLLNKISEYPKKLSGGEQQRVAIARALVTSPELLICDEPTGALDQETGKLVLNLLHERVKTAQTTLLLVTHDMDVASTCSKIFTMDGGRLNANFT